MLSKNVKYFIGGSILGLGVVGLAHFMYYDSQKRKFYPLKHRPRVIFRVD